MRKSYTLGVYFLLSFFSLDVFRSQTPSLWGLTPNGGSGYGTLFSVNTGSTAISNQFDFVEYPGNSPQYVKLTQAPNGKLYGTTRIGGTNNLGVLFEYDAANNTYSVLVNFDGTNKGSLPWTTVLLASNGRLYGTTQTGGTNNLGTLFEYNIGTNTFTKLHDMVLVNGSQPFGSLTQASNGILYGVNLLGGNNSVGTLFEYNLSLSTYSVLVHFAPALGSSPMASPIQASGGKLYGATTAGGSSANGVIYEYNISTNTYSVVFNFTAALTGNNALAPLMQASNGIIYGANNSGGPSGLGAVFGFDPGVNSFSLIAAMTGTATGSNPQGELTQASNGKLYGLSRNGGLSNTGALYELDITTNTYTKLYNFVNASGISPQGAVTQSTNGLLYGVTMSGGSNNAGVLFEYNIGTNVYTKKLDFNTSSGGQPLGSLVQANNGKLYGLASSGGTANAGAVFEYDMGLNTYTKTVDLNTSLGNLPSSNMVQAPNGKLYGMTRLGGANNAGVIFEYDYTLHAYTKKHDMLAANGSQPFGSLYLASNGKFYGMTYQGGSVNTGVIFEYDYVNNTYTKKVDLTLANGSNPYGSLTEATNGKLYGLTRNGGANGLGVLFEYVISSNTYSKIVDFTALGGSLPEGSLVQVGNGNLYGLTTSGGTNSVGVLFEFSPSTNTYSKLFDFSALNGHTPGGTLRQASNAKLYGLTKAGGANGLGVLFEYDITGSTYTKKLDLSVSSGNGPMYTQLIEVCETPLSPGSINSSFSSVCAGTSGSHSFSVSSVAAATAYVWNFPAGTSILSGSNTNAVSVDFAGVTAGTYTLEVMAQNICGNSSPSTFTAAILAGPSVSVNSGSICSNQSFTLSPSGASTYTFSNGSAIVSPTINSTYSVVGTGSNGCVSLVPAVSNITVHALPVITANNGTICAGSSFTIIPGGASTYTYSSGTNVVSPGVSTWFAIIGTDASGCVSAIPAISNVLVYDLPVIGISNGSICAGNAFTLNPSGAISYTYSGGLQVVSPTVTTNYSVTGTDANGCVSGSPAVSTVTVNARPVISVNSGAICLNGVFTMTPTGASTYTFSSGSNTVSPLSDSSYSVTGTNSLSCVSASAAIANVTVNPLPLIGVNSGSTCAGNTFTLIASGASTYTYSGGSNLVNPVVTTTYSVTGTSSLGCISVVPAITTITVSALPFVTVNSGTICNTNSFTIVPSGALTYTYSSGSAVVSPTVSTSYSVIGSSSLGCISSNTAVSTVTVYQRPFITVNSGSICATKNFTMLPNGASTYTYSGGNNVVTPTTSTFYTVIGTSSLGCISSNTAVANVTVAPSPTIVVNSGTICTGKVFTMTPSGALTYTFFNGTNTVSPVINTSYSVTGTNPLGCISPVPGVSSVTVIALPNVLISGTNSLCYGNSTNLTASGAQSYSWSTGTSGSLAAVTLTAPSTYSVIGVAGNGCSKIAAFTMSVLPLPTISISSAVICPGNSFVLSPSGAFTYTYSSGSATVFPLTTTSYSVTGTNANGCVSANPAVATVSVVNTLTVTVSGNTDICEGESANLIANGASTYTWNTGASSNTISITPSVTTTYTVLGSSGSCRDTSNITVNVNALPVLQVGSSASVICVNEEVEINVTGAVNYTWSSQQTSSTIFVTPSVTTTYTVYGISANNCLNTAVFTQSVSDCVALPERTFGGSNIKLFPNPNSGKFYIELVSPSQIDIISVLGERIYTSALSSGIHELSIDEFANGVYTISVRSEYHKQSLRLIKQ